METSSPFISQLGSNYAATSEEAAELTSFLTGPISKLAKLEDEIDRAKAHYDELVARHTELSHEINRHQALMAPIRRLPVDVIREIFMNCLPTTHNAIISPEECPILLTRICSGWRNIALGTAVLWASIHLPIPTDVDSNARYDSDNPPMQHSPQFLSAMTIAKRQARAITEWLSRSGECILAISLYNQEHGTSVEIYNVILDALIPFCKRWGSLKCDAPASNLIRIANIPGNDLPQLHTLAINGGRFARGALPVDDQGGVWCWKDSGVVCAPRLRAIVYNNIAEDFASFPLRWRQLTSITIYGGMWGASEVMSLRGLAALLATCHLLHDCRLHISPGPHQLDERAPGMPASILLPYLQEFAIQSDHMDLSPLLDLLDVPTLSRLEVNTCLFIAAPLHALIRRSAHTLRALTLSPNIFTREEFFACLQTGTDLTELTLRGGLYSRYAPTPPLMHHQNGANGVTVLLDEAVAYAPLVLDDAFLYDVLVPAPGAGPVFVPLLTTFACHMLGTFSDTGVMDAVCARRAAAALGEVTPLRQVQIAFGRPQEQSIAHAIKELEDQGVKCTLTYMPSFPSRKNTPTDGVFDFVNSQ